jgi:hypothetical protein
MFQISLLKFPVMGAHSQMKYPVLTVLGAAGRKAIS